MVGIDSLQACVRVDIKIAEEIVPVLTLIADEIVLVFGIDSLQACVRVDIDS